MYYYQVSYEIHICIISNKHTIGDPVLQSKSSVSKHLTKTMLLETPINLNGHRLINEISFLLQELTSEIK